MAILTGLFRLGKDAVIRYTTEGVAVCTLSLAYNYGKKNAQKMRPTQWIEVDFWGERAVTLEPYLKKSIEITAVLEDVHIEDFVRSDKTHGTKLVGKLISLEFTSKSDSQ